MVSRYRGRVGEYMRQIEQERMERYKDRPWELYSRSRTGGELFVLAFICGTIISGLLLFSLF